MGERIMNDFAAVIQALFQRKTGPSAFTIFDSVKQFEKEPPHASGTSSKKDVLPRMNAAFFIKLMGPEHPNYENAKDFFERHRLHSSSV